ncbi:hypothetical protein ACIQ34_00455 [Ureibacillus sp. NPDC094379]
MSKLNEAINSNNIRGIKSAILAYLSADPLDQSGEIKNAISAVDSKGIILWESHDDTELLQNPTSWTKDYFAELQSHLITNFSKERLVHALKVGRHAYREELNRPKQAAPSQRPTSARRPQQGGNNDMGKMLVAGAAILAVGLVIYLVAK